MTAKIRNRVLAGRFDQSNLWAVINITLLVSLALMLFIYVVQMNAIASTSYQTKMISEKISDLSETQAILMANKLIVEGENDVTGFAQSINMEESGTIVSLIEGSGVAFQR